MEFRVKAGLDAPNQMQAVVIETDGQETSKLIFPVDMAPAIAQVVLAMYLQAKQSVPKVAIPTGADIGKIVN